MIAKTIVFSSFLISQIFSKKFKESISNELVKTIRDQNNEWEPNDPDSNPFKDIGEANL